MKSFIMSRLPVLYFGTGSFLPTCEKLFLQYGIRKLTVITGGRSFSASPSWEKLRELLAMMKVDWKVFSVSGEPTPEFVDGVRRELSGTIPDAVLAVGGGSAVDAGKAVSAMVLEEGSVAEYLEGVGTRVPSGRKIPFFAVPTTAGTGSEATKNAVISRIGDGGFKKSLRHDAYIPDAAIVDAELAIGCPQDVTAASGLDAVTQLLEAYVSPAASPLTDACAESGLQHAGGAFLAAFRKGTDLEARAGMGYGAFLSGICLANAGLGVVHAVASPLGALRPIPHGVVCGTLLSASVEATVRKLRGQGRTGEPALLKYAKAGALLSGKDTGDRDGNLALLRETLEAWTAETGISRLGVYGLTAGEAGAVAARTVSKNYPVAFSVPEIESLILERL